MGEDAVSVGGKKVSKHESLVSRSTIEEQSSALSAAFPALAKQIQPVLMNARSTGRKQPFK